MRDHYLKVGSKIYDVGAAWRGWVRRGVGYDKRDATKSRHAVRPEGEYRRSKSSSSESSNRGIVALGLAAA
jgi:hypothetical protein